MSIVVNSVFLPLTYKDLMAPILDYKLAYEQVEAAYSDLAAQTEAWRDIANQENSPEAYAMYKNYASLLNAIVDDFSQGMNARNRGQLLDMKRRYASDIEPIARAYEAMTTANKFRDEKGPDAIFEEGNYNSLDRFLHGLVANNNYESRKDITARTAALTLTVAQSILYDPIIKLSMHPLFLEKISKHGIGSLEELEAVIAGNPLAMNRFALIKNKVIGELGGLDRFDAEGRTAVEGAIHEGLHVGLYNYSSQLADDKDYIYGYLGELLRREQEKLDIATGKKPFMVDPITGTEHYANSLYHWTRSIETKDDQYVYKDSLGTEHLYDGVLSDELMKEEKVTPKWVMGNMEPIKKSTNGGSGEEEKHVKVGGHYLDNNDYIKLDDVRKYIQAVGYEDLTFAEKGKIELAIKKFPGAKISGLKFYIIGHNEDTDLLTYYDDPGVTRRIIYTDR